jgi:type I restriction enzyme S subunit
LGDILTLLKDGTHGTHLDVKDGPLLLSAKNIKNGNVSWDDTDRRISQKDFESIHSSFTLHRDDILLTIVGSIGETAILQDINEITFQRSVAYLRPTKEIKPQFLYSEIQTPRFKKELENRKSTSAQPGIYLGDLSVIPVNYPDNAEEQQQIGNFFCNLDNLITLHQRKLLGTFDYKAAKRNLKEAYHFHGAVLFYSDLSLP